jgi:hypothetical protein
MGGRFGCIAADELPLGCKVFVEQQIPGIAFAAWRLVAERCAGNSIRRNSTGGVRIHGVESVLLLL